MPDSPTSGKVKHCGDTNSEEDEVELVEESLAAASDDKKGALPPHAVVPKSWPQTLQDLRNNNNQGGFQPLIYPRPSSELLRPTTMLQHHPLFPPRFGSQIPGAFPGGWLYNRGLHPAAPPLPAPSYPIGRGHELMRRLCTMNPAFAQSIIEDYIRPQVIC